MLGQQITFPTVTVEPQLDGTVSITGLEGTTVSLAGGIIDASIQAALALALALTQYQLKLSGSASMASLPSSRSMFT